MKIAFSSLRPDARAVWLVAAFAAISVTQVAAQETRRYVTTDQGGVYIESPMGAMEVEAEGYSEVRFEISGTSIIAKYDTLYSYVGGSQGDQSPDVTPIMEGSFELEMERPGVLVTLSHPSVEAEGAGGMEPLHMFDDFLVPLPDEPLAVGVEWTEMMVHDGASQPDATYYSERAMSMRVERDTVVNGEPAFVVSVAQNVTNESSGIMPGMGFEFTSSSDGTDNGTAILAGDGTLLHRERTIEMAGLFSIMLQGQVFDMPQTMSFTGTQKLVADN
ncbi:MAG: hypothetical protein OEU54_08210 [Gemmatimonadota bacterium]|nr:hypothetical protein [Gemmatimonadota bacterium]